jgi:pimeloyl-ACP methyl ester carboxylesterase
MKQPAITAAEEPSATVQDQSQNVKDKLKSNAKSAIGCAQGQFKPGQKIDLTCSTHSIKPKFVTAQDPVIETTDGGRSLGVRFEEAVKLSQLKGEVEGRTLNESGTVGGKDDATHEVWSSDHSEPQQSTSPEALSLTTIPLARTNPLFPPLPIYGSPSLSRDLECLAFRVSSFFLSLCFLGVIVLGAFFTWLPLFVCNLGLRILCQDPKMKRQFYEEEKRRTEARRQANKEWRRRQKTQSPTCRRKSQDEERDHDPDENKHCVQEEEFIPREGGPDPLVRDVGYYARRVGLDCETFHVQTEDGFIIELWHLYNPLTYTPKPTASRSANSPDIMFSIPPLDANPPNGSKYPTLFIHGLLQSAGACCCTDEHSLAFYFAKSGLDVWLGNNRCGFHPKHTLLQPSDPRMWAWNIRQMGVMDLPALIARVLSETEYPQLALVAHSQGTTETLVALAKEQRPEIGRRISVACLLAPAAYAGPLIEKMYFKFMRVISPAMFRVIFGIHSFIPIMMDCHRFLHRRFYGFMGYRVFHFLFNWSDKRWEKELRDRCFQFAPVYVSAESMRWWLGSDCFARQKCILATREEGKIEDEEDADSGDEETLGGEKDQGHRQKKNSKSLKERMRFAWYDQNVPPLALWVCGSDNLVNGKRLLRRFDKGREPWVEVVHSKIIEGYEHLDVLWAIDCIEEVGKEVLETIWKTVPANAKIRCKIPRGCQDIQPWKGRRRDIDYDSPPVE